MPPFLADRNQFGRHLRAPGDPLALAAAMSRHPAAGARATVSPLPGAARGVLPVPAGPGPGAGAAPFTTVAALLTGPWRVNDPVPFAAAMRAAPLVAGHAVVDVWRLPPPLSGGQSPSPGLCSCARQPTAQLDPLSAAVAGHLESAVAAAANRSGLAVRWVAARGGSDLFVEAAARAPADTEGPELLVLAHLVEPLAGGCGADDDSWVVIVVGDGRGGVAGIGRAALDTAARPRPGTATGFDRRLPVRLNLDALRARLAGPARAAGGLTPPACGPAAEGMVLPFRR